MQLVLLLTALPLASGGRTSLAELSKHKHELEDELDSSIALDDAQNLSTEVGAPSWPAQYRITQNAQNCQGGMDLTSGRQCRLAAAAMGLTFSNDWYGWLTQVLHLCE